MAIVIILAVLAIFLVFAAIGTVGSYRQPAFVPLDPDPFIAGPYGGTVATSAPIRRPTTTQDSTRDLPPDVTVVRPDVRWVMPLPAKPGTTYSAPVHVGSLLVVRSSAGDLLGIDVATRSIRWTTPDLGSAPPGSIGSVTSVNDDTLLFGSTRAVDAVTGHDRWNLPSLFAGSAAHDPAHVIMNDGITVSARAPLTGATQWEVPAGPSSVDTGMNGMRSAGAIAVVDDLAILSGPDVLRALDVNTGRERWRTPVAVIGVPPMIVIGSVLIAATAGRISGLDTRTGQELWSRLERDVGDAKGIRDMHGGGSDVVYVWSGTDRVSALRATTGETIWKQDSLLQGSSPLAAPKLLGDRIIAYPSFNGLRSGGLIQRADTGAVVGYVDFGFPRRTSTFDFVDGLFVSTVTTSLPGAQTSALVGFALP